MKYKAPVGQLDPEATYIDKDPALGVKGSPVPAYFVNATMKEIVNAIILLGGNPEEMDFEQLGKRVKEYVENQFAIKQATNSEISNKYNIQKYINPSQASRYLGFYDENRSYDINEVVVLNGMIYYSLVDNNIDNNPLTSKSSWAEFSSGSGGGYIGQITHGLRTDTPEGQLRLDGNEYPTTVYQAFINSYLLTGKIPYKSLADYEVEMTMTGGNCGVFGYDVDGAVLRVPKIKDKTYIMQALTSGLGSFTSAGLPNATGTIDGNIIDGNAKGIISVKSGRKGTAEGVVFLQGYTGGSNHLEIDLSVDSGIYGNSDTVQTNAISYPLFICVSNVAVPASEAQYNGFIEGLNNKVDVDGSNATFNSLSIKAIKNILEINTLDFNKGVNITTNITYTVPDNGWLRLYAPTGSSVGYKSNLDKEQDITYSLVNNLSIGENIYFKISKDEVINRTFLTGGAKSYFYYNK